MYIEWFSFRWNDLVGGTVPVHLPLSGKKIVFTSSYKRLRKRRNLSTMHSGVNYIAMFTVFFVSRIRPCTVLTESSGFDSGL